MYSPTYRILFFGKNRVHIRVIWRTVSPNVLYPNVGMCFLTKSFRKGKLTSLTGALRGRFELLMKGR